MSSEPAATALAARDVMNDDLRPVVQLLRVTKEFPNAESRTIVALDDVSLTVEGGEALGIIGPNGAGKSTALRIIAGVTAPTAGLVRRVRDVSSIIDLGAAVHPYLTCRENFSLLARLAGVPRSVLRPRVAEMVEFSGLGDVMDTPARHLSAGMLARMTFSVAVRAEPSLLLLDEVLSVGDLAFQQQCVGELTTLNTEGTTLIVVSHDLEMIQTICTRAVVVASGVVDFDGSPTAAIRHYLHEIDESTASTLPVTLRTDTLKRGQRLHLHIGDWQPDHGSTLRLELAFRSHPGASLVGRHMAMRFSSTRLPAVGLTGRTLEIDTSGLPAGAFELWCTLEDPHRRPIRSDYRPFTVVGPPGPFTIQVAASTSVHPLTPTTVRTTGVGR